MLSLWFMVVSLVTLGSAQISWFQVVQLKDREAYFHKVMQETVYELEKKEWCNLKLLDISQTLNEQMYDWLVAGTVNYTNGFVVSIQKIDVDPTVAFSISTRSADNTTQATVQASLYLRDVDIGFDVKVNLKDEEQTQHYTGSFTYLKIQIQFTIVKNLHLNTITSTPHVIAVNNGGRKMVYMPANHLTEVLSRRYVPGDILEAVRVWASDIINPIVLEVAEKRIPFPEYVPGDILEAVRVWASDIINPIVLEVAEKRIPFPEVCFNNC